jgi:alcohol dehydrogenase class IV
MVREPIIGKVAGTAFLEDWLQGKQDIVLVTGRASYATCGAKDFFEPFLHGKSVTHLITVGENARAEDVADKRAQLPERIDAYIAVGGGTAIDTAKLVRGLEEPLPPFLAVPTTAGTGAETTRFAVYYDHGVKKSADDVRYLPTDQILIPEFTATQSPYQRASTEFDAYAQAVESLWAVGATDESRAYARKALDLMAAGEQMLGSYWAGRAIDISRTTAAHALSYYMTANYGIPHGHAVYMMFPYVCKANGHPEFIREVPELQSLRAFAAAKGLDWDELVVHLLANVNPQRLANDPAPIGRDVFAVEEWGSGGMGEF